MLKDYQRKILELLEQLEMELANLYQLFAEKYPGHKDLWDAMVAEETEHAVKLKKLSSMIDEGQVIFDEKMTKTYTVQIFIDNIKKVYAEAQTGKMPLLKALVLSNDFEKSIIEKKFYDYFLLKDPGVSAIFNAIREETNQHSLNISTAMKEEKSR